MPRKPNYNFERAERDRAKQAKKEEKLLQKKEQSAQRKVAKDTESPSGENEAGGSGP